MDIQRSKNYHSNLKELRWRTYIIRCHNYYVVALKKRKERQKNKVTIPEKYLHLIIIKVKINDAAEQWGQEFIFSINSLGSIRDPFDKKVILTPFLTYKNIQDDYNPE